jgi:hypothetical protein
MGQSHGFNSVIWACLQTQTCTNPQQGKVWMEGRQCVFQVAAQFLHNLCITPCSHSLPTPLHVSSRSTPICHRHAANCNLDSLSPPRCLAVVQDHHACDTSSDTRSNQPLQLQSNGFNSTGLHTEVSMPVMSHSRSQSRPFWSRYDTQSDMQLPNHTPHSESQQHSIAGIRFNSQGGGVGPDGIVLDVTLGAAQTSLPTVEEGGGVGARVLRFGSSLAQAGS